MLARPLSRLELQPDDKEELEAVKRAQQQQQQQLQGQQQQGQQPAYLQGDKRSAAARIGVEVKIRLPDRAAYERVAELLGACKKASYAQENYFFDGDAAQLEATHTVLRLRFYNGAEKATVTIKGKQVLEKGIGRSPEVEEAVSDPVAARAWLQQPDAMLEHSPLLQQFNKSVGMQRLVCMGGFKNQRDVFEWEGETLELDQTMYEWGTLYEIEVETAHPEALRNKLESFLASNGVQYSYSKTSKFANFKNRSLL